MPETPLICVWCDEAIPDPEMKYCPTPTQAMHRHPCGAELSIFLNENSNNEEGETDIESCLALLLELRQRLRKLEHDNLKRQQLCLEDRLAKIEADGLYRLPLIETLYMTELFPLNAIGQKILEAANNFARASEYFEHMCHSGSDKDVTQAGLRVAASRRTLRAMLAQHHPAVPTGEPQ